MTPDVAALVRELVGTVCRCGRPKKARMVFCWACYRRLDRHQQAALYRLLGHGYEEAYADAVTALESFTCPDCGDPLDRVTDPRAADRFVCHRSGCGRVWVLAEWGPSGLPVFL